MANNKVNGCELDEEQLSAIVVDCGYQLHVNVGPGLLEIVYEALLERMLLGKGLKVERQVPVPVSFPGFEVDSAFRIDLLIEGRLVVELKSVETLAPVHVKQVATYLRLLGFPLGLLLNFGAATFKEGARRVVNRHTRTENSLLRINLQPGMGPAAGTPSD